ncbi:energy-coupling factor ABC transporter ATP-binding protein [Streptomyces alanosinicus]|uniref:ABC transporter ATP-binding protein n=1 Tax=Streptomyces alanosinicus TaxID=68171 RepID=A0A918YK47_9ACTN|nr:ABC transporter ATP-binding protein [Streptomyces alanosinicus]GHE06744.1 ABC transporter ATP-binding protein [Streptomyces alanosinicus]
MIEFRDFSLTYPTGSRPALQKIDFIVPRGQICAVVGADGAGKSTLAGVISGVVPHMTGGETTGWARIGSRMLAETPASELVGEVALVMQNPFNQLSGARFSLREEIAFGLENLGVDRAEMVRRVEQVMADLRLTALADLSPYEMSGGQQQLLAIGSALVMRPAVMVLDEPTSQLDAVGAGVVFDALETLRTQGVTVILFEHRMERPARCVDRVLVLDEGRIAADGQPDDVLTDPRLADWGVAPLRYTTAARQAVERGLWEADRPLPVTLEAAAEGFDAALKGARTAGGL